MFEKKKILVLLAAAALVAACGGGGGGGGNDGSTSAVNTGTPPADTGNTPPPNDTGGAPAAPADQQLKGHLTMVANQLVYLRTDRSEYWATPLHQFESSEGMYDAASGSKDGAGPTPPPAAAPAAPLASFGLRVDRFVHRADGGEPVGNQIVVGRVAFDLTERDDSPGISAGQAPEIMKFVIDGVELSTDANGELVSARAREGAQMHVYGRTATKVEVRESVPVSAGAVRLKSMEGVLDAYGDNTSIVLLVDLEHAFSQAAQRLAALENIAGHFSMKVTTSAAQVLRPAAPATSESPELERKFLEGEPIAVNSQAPVVGAGISGNAWIRMYPPQQ